MSMRDFNWGGLIAMSLRAPRMAAATLINLNLPSGVIWTALALVSCGNAILAGISELIFPSPMEIPAVLANPLMLFVLLAGGVVISSYALVWGGSKFGGDGRLEDVAIVLTWLQALRALAQAVVVVLAILSPGLAGLFAMVVMFAGLWIMANFVAQALNFASAWKAFGLMLGLMVGFVFVIVLLLMLTGFGMGG
ncbi:YIP1 family protein [Pseudosulfitobacter koreensis]|uniref:YIP1 family protein n=1 Tax=Pseudosulfitobacter koreensis TaxID=2968472 RepID=A0ABT1Z1Z9_9RHOB|nr:YIP1 family protein [Pseudosulfitobacter koreense]MCR8827171.1 YIP1 family protein [Pseudosulfitobacter koreense]